MWRCQSVCLQNFSLTGPYIQPWVRGGLWVGGRSPLILSGSQPAQPLRFLPSKMTYFTTLWSVERIHHICLFTVSKMEKRCESLFMITEKFQKVAKYQKLKFYNFSNPNWLVVNIGLIVIPGWSFDILHHKSDKIVFIYSSCEKLIHSNRG